MLWARSNTNYRCGGGCTLEPLLMEFWRDIHKVALLEDLNEVELLAGLKRIDDGQLELLQVLQWRRTGLAMRIATLYSATH
jgi:hypothetical protein